MLHSIVHVHVDFHDYTHGQGSIMSSSKLLHNDEDTHACNVYQSVGEETGSKSVHAD